MEIIKNFLLLIIFTFIEFNSLANPPFEIYYGKKGSWYVYLDVRKEIMVVEVAGIKYGFLDVLINKGQNDTVASSDVGVLLVENDTYYYINKELKLKIKLNKYNYTEKMDANRYKLFEIDAFNKILLLKEKFGVPDYVIDSDEIYNDFISFRDSIKYDYSRPSYIVRFHKERK